MLGTDHGYFPRVREVVVFPTEFRTPVAADDWEDDLLSETPLAGQAVNRGPVLLAWDVVLAEGRDPDAGYNVVIHEFAHQLDFFDGLAGGTPHLSDRDLQIRWHEVLIGAFENHRTAYANALRALATVVESPGVLICRTVRTLAGKSRG